MATNPPAFGFGSPASATGAVQQPSFGFGTQLQQQQQQPANTTFSFSSPAAAPAMLGGAARPATLSQTPNFGFNQSGTTTTPSLGFSSSAPATGLNFSTTTTSSTAGAPQLNFNTSQQSGLLGARPAPLFGLTSTTSALGGGGGGLFNPNPSLSTTTLPTAAPAPIPVGLGGVDINATLPKTVEGKTDGAKVKESQLPQEIISTVDSMKAYIKQQKTISSDIARTSQRQLNHVTAEMQNLYRVLSEISNSVETNYAAIKSLRSETGQAIHHAEMAQRTHETPAGLQFENSAPLVYFMDLVQKYENDMILFRNQVEMTEKHMRSLASPQSFSADDLKRGLHQIHESFIALAGRHHEIHQKVEAQKEIYLNLRKYYLHDKTNVFEVSQNVADKSSYSNVTLGPTPFSTLSSSLNQLSQTTQTPQNASSSAFGIGGNATLGSSFMTAGNTDSTAFNLQKPPALGGKRNKQSFF